MHGVACGTISEWLPFVLLQQSTPGAEVTGNAEKLKSLRGRVASVTKGLDICFLVDCTGSMVRQV